MTWGPDFANTAWGAIIGGIVGSLASLAVALLNQRFTKKLEEAKPMTAEDVLRREEWLRSRIRVYEGALEVVYKQANQLIWTFADGTTAPPSSDIGPTRVEINLAYARLLLYSTADQIPAKFHQITNGTFSAADIGKLVGLMRKDLGHGDSLVEPASFPVSLGPKSRVSSAA